MVDMKLLEEVLNNSSKTSLMLIEHAILRKYNVDAKVLKDKVVYTRNNNIVSICKDSKKESLIKFILTATVEFLIPVKFFIDLGF
jgi:hypothetical protein|nr:MAG TPA: hypothetical protein [Ackermannviridae sp.]